MHRLLAGYIGADEVHPSMLIAAIGLNVLRVRRNGTLLRYAESEAGLRGH